MTWWQIVSLTGSVAILSLTAGCGNGSEPSGTPESQTPAGPASTVGGENELTRDGITGPGPGLVATWLTSTERTGGVRLVPAGWQVTELEITEWVNDGDQVDPLIRANFTGRAVLTESIYRTREDLATLNSFDTSELRLEGSGSDARIVGEPERGRGVLLVDLVHEAGAEVELHGKFAATRLAGQWVPVPDPDSGRPGLMLAFLDENPFAATGSPESTLEFEEMIVAGSAREAEYRAKLRSREHAYIQTATKLIADRDRERQAAADAEAAAAEAAAAERRATAYRRKMPAVEARLGGGTVWVTKGTLPRNIITTLRFDSWDHETGTATGETYVIGGFRPYRKSDSWAIRRTFTAQVPAEGDGIRITVVEGEDLIDSPNREAPPVRLDITANDAGRGLTARFRRGSGSGTIEFEAVPATEVEDATAAAAANMVGRTVAMTMRGVDGEVVGRVEFEVFAYIPVLDRILGRQVTTFSERGVRDRYVIGQIEDGVLTAFDYAAGDTDDGHSHLYSWELALDDTGEVISGKACVLHMQRPEDYRTLEVEPAG